MTLQVSDSRSRPFYWIENEAWELLAHAVKDCGESDDPQRRRIGPLLHAVYHALCRYLNNKAKVARPHVKTICAAVGAGVWLVGGRLASGPWRELGLRLKQAWLRARLARLKRRRGLRVVRGGEDDRGPDRWVH